MRRKLTILLSILMLISLLPVSALADDGEAASNITSANCETAGPASADDPETPTAPQTPGNAEGAGASQHFGSSSSVLSRGKAPTGQDADYAFPRPTVSLGEILSALGLSLTQNRYNVSVDADAVACSSNNVNKNDSDACMLTAVRGFDLASLTLTSANGKDSFTVTLSYSPDQTYEAMATFTSDNPVWAGAVLYLTGRMPVGVIADAEPVYVEIDGEQVMAAYDVIVYANEEQKNAGVAWQPTDSKVQMHFFAQGLNGTVNLYHLPDRYSAPEFVDTVTAENGWAVFEAEHFSIYAVTVTLEKELVAGDGHSYRVSVTYDAAAQLPGDAALDVTELTPEDPSYRTYLDRTAQVLGRDNFSYARVFDITITDARGNQLEPAAPVRVRVELLDADADSDLDVVHFDGEPEALDAQTDDAAVSFRTDGFSVYTVVDAPAPTNLDWQTVDSGDYLKAHGGDGFYIGHADGFFFLNTTVSDSAGRVGIAKKKPAQEAPSEDLPKYYFEHFTGDQFFVYCYNGTVRQYVFNNNNNSLSLTSDENEKTAFTVSVGADHIVTVRNGEWYWNMQRGANGNRFCSYNQENDVNNNLYIWRPQSIGSEPYGLDGRSFGVMSYNGGVTGKAMAASSDTAGTGALDARTMLVRVKSENGEDKYIYVPSDNNDLPLWTFHWVSDDKYRIESGGKYLRISSDGLSLTDTQEEAGLIRFIPGSGDYSGQFCLQSDSVPANTLTYSGAIATGFSVNGSAGSEWLCFVQKSSIDDSDYLRTYSARKVSASEVPNGAHVVVYTRVWNDAASKYEFWAVDGNGGLKQCFESGDHIQWLEGSVNTLVWDFTEYYWDGTTTPNDYYELCNESTELFLAPQAANGQLVSAGTIGLNLKGRQRGYYQTTIAAWDGGNYAYSALKAGDVTAASPTAVACPLREAEDFYFAIVEELPADDNLNTVRTLDHTKNGITVKVFDYEATGNTTDKNPMSDFLGNGEGGVGTMLQQGLLSTDLGPDGYPRNTGGVSLGTKYAGATEVNHLFIESTYSNSGYFEYDSTQNFASLKGDYLDGDGIRDFVMYKELGTYDSGGNKPSLKHGQFFPFNDIEPGVFASVNGKNLYDANATGLSDNNPRKYERLYLIKKCGLLFRDGDRSRLHPDA